MKKSIRLISLLLAMVLCFSCMTIGVQAARADYTYPAGKDALEHYYISAEQCATMILDKIDLDVLGSEENAEKLKGKIDVPTILEWICSDFSYDLTSIDKAFDTLIRLYDSDIYSLGTKVNLGDLEEINISDIRYGRPTRTSTGNTDLNVLVTVFKFLRTNKDLIGKLIDGKWDNGGIASWFIDVNEMLGDVHQKIREAAFNGLFQDDDAVKAAKQANIDNTSELDAMVNYFVSDLLGSEKIKSKLPSLQSELGANFSLNSITVYELLRKVLRTAINDFGRPLLTDALASNEEIWPIITGLLSWDVPMEDESGNPLPKDDVVNYMVDNILDFRNGILSRYIKVTDYGISLEDGFQSLLNQLMDTARGLMSSLASFDTVEMLSSEDLASLSNPQMLAYVGRTLLLSLVDYMVIPLKMPVRDASTGVVTYEPLDGYALATYALINIMADKMPEKNYYQMIDNYINNVGTEDDQLNPGQKEVLRIDGTTGKVLEYKEPAAFTVLADYLYYFLNGKTTMEIPKGLNFDETLQWVFIWAVNQWGGLVRTDNLNLTTTPNMNDLVVWKNLDALLWDNVLDITWLPKNFGSSFKTVQNGVTTYTGKVTRKLLLENILYPIVSFDLTNLSKILEIFNMNVGGELDQDIVNFILTLLKRLLNGMFQQTDRIFGGTQITKLEDIVSKTEYNGKTNLRILAENLCEWLPVYGEAILRSALPLVADSLANMGGDRVDKHNYDVYCPEGISYTIDDLRQKLEAQRPSNKIESDMMTDDDYFFFGGEDFDPLFKYYNYRDVWKDATDLVTQYDNELEADEPNLEQFNEDINTYTYRLGYYYDRLSLRDPNVSRLLDEVANAKARFGYGERGSATAHGTNAEDSFDSTDFTLRTWNQYLKALAFAQKVYNEYLLNDSGTLRQSKITAARRLLVNAEKGLKFMGGEADYSVLMRLISLALSDLNAGKANPDLYIESTLENLQNAYNEAIKVDLGYDEDDQDIIDAAAENLEAAIDGLLNQPQLVKVDKKTTVLDKENWIIYGVAEGLKNYFSYVTNIGSIGFVNYKYTANGSGTGTKIILEDESVGEIQSYTIIVYGDVDGDSYADATDANVVYAYVAGDLLPKSYLSDYALMAADADNDGAIDTLDAYYLRRAGLKQYTVDQRGEI